MSHKTNDAQGLSRSEDVEAENTRLKAERARLLDALDKIDLRTISPLEAMTALVTLKREFFKR